MFISKKAYIFLFSMLGLVYFLGFFFPLMDLDATEYAMVALRMVQRQDYLHIISRSLITTQEYDYLDKPHLSFWLEALSYLLLGVKDYAYRFPSFLFTVLGTYSTFRLGKRLYNPETGWLSALFFVSSQAIILENHDARTDAILGGAVIFGIWQLVEFLNTQKSRHLVWGILGIVLGVATKGMIAVVVAVTALFFWFLYTREWNRLRDIRWWLGIPLFFLLLSPVLYCYYVQFDLHPEILVKGDHHVSGVKFLLWSQSFERYAGKGEYVQYPEFSFFFHTYLWAFLPWSLLSYISIAQRGFEIWKTRFKKVPGMEWITWGSGISLFLLLSGMQYKMPHYINVLFPFFSILLASFLMRLMMEKQTLYLKILRYIQGLVLGITVLLGVLLNAYCFPLHNPLYWIPIVFLFLLALHAQFWGKNSLVQLIVPSAMVIIIVNLLLNGNFYPQLLQFQPGNVLAQYAQSHNLKNKEVFYYGGPSRSFDFYTQFTHPCLDSLEIMKHAQTGKPFYLWVEKAQIPKLHNLSLKESVLIEVPEFRVTLLNWQFLNPKTRKNALSQVDMVKIN